jgi:phosphohistidine phosphatase
MKRQLVLIRHTKSSWKNPLLPDFERPIKKDRAEDAQTMAKLLKDMGLKPDLVICSPALRTRQTAAYFCEKLKYPSSKVAYDQRLYESSAEEILEVVRETDAAIKQLIIVGHNPSSTHFVNLFLENKIEEIPTTGVVWLEFDSSNWDISSSTANTLKGFFTPKQNG